MSDASGPTVYRLRANAFVKPRSYRLSEDALTWEEDGGKSGGVRYDGIAEVRLAFAPTRIATNRYRAQIVLKAGGTIELFNVDCRGLADFADLSGEYIAFVTELHKRLAVHGRRVIFRQGNSVAGFVGNVAMTIFVFVMIAAAFLLLFSWGGPLVAVVKLAILLFFVPLLVRYIRRARPGTYDPLALPAAVLPEVSGEEEEKPDG
jgi:hypothetical protein